MRLIDAGALQKEHMKCNDGKRLMLVDVAPTVDAVSREEYDKLKDLCEQYKFEYECALDALKEVQNEVLPNRVEVVRCKECEWWELVDVYYAKSYGECTCPRSVIKRPTFLNENWYCADGERKDE